MSKAFMTNLCVVEGGLDWSFLLSMHASAVRRRFCFTEHQEFPPFRSME